MSKKTLLFDASVISDNFSNFSAGRSDIYFVAYNILTNLMKSQKFDISLFCNNVCSKDFVSFIEKNFGKNVKIHFGNKYASLLNKLSILNAKLRAMKCGCPIITSNNSSLPEVVGDAGIMIDWDNDEPHIAAYEKYYFDEKYRKTMATRGLARSKLFSWDKTIQLIIDEFNKGANV